MTKPLQQAVREMHELAAKWKAEAPHNGSRRLSILRCADELTQLADRLAAEGGPLLQVSLNQAQQLVAFFGGENTDVSIQYHEDHLHAWCTEYPEEGSVSIGEFDPDAPVQDGEARNARGVDNEALIAVPDGYALVPLEPTREMIEATKGCMGRVNDILAHHQLRYGEIDLKVDGNYPMWHAYKAMLAAATVHKPASVSRSTQRAPESGERDALTFDAFRAANVARCIKWHPAGIASWSPSDWLTAVTGELGELASLLKMRNRERDGLPGNKFSPTDKQVADELADVLTYLDLLASVLGVDLGRAAVSKFNEVSERVGFPDRINLSDTALRASGGKGEVECNRDCDCVGTCKMQEQPQRTVQPQPADEPAMDLHLSHLGSIADEMQRQHDDGRAPWLNQFDIDSVRAAQHLAELRRLRGGK